MRVLLVNEVCGFGSTGRICVNQARELQAQGHTVRLAYGRSRSNLDGCEDIAVRIGSPFSVLLHGLAARLFDAQGLGSYGATKRFLRWADGFDPELVCLHNLHGYYLNYPLLFAWIKSRPDMQLRWTLHDCWAFTGHCAYYSMTGCRKWQTGCEHCPQKRSYPKSLFVDRSSHNYRRKMEAFLNVKQMKLIVPSVWLREQLKDSFLAEYPVEVVRNRIDDAVFAPTQGDFKKRHGLEGKKIVLGVSSAWKEPRKGFKDFLALAKLLTEDWRIVLVGLEKKQMRGLPNNILGLSRVQNARELAQVYTAANVLFNPSYDDNYPTVNLEAEACGTRVVCYDAGGAPETIRRPDSAVIRPGDIAAAWQAIRRG